MFAGESDRRHHDHLLAYYTAYHAGLYSQPFKRFPKYERGAPRRRDGRPRKRQGWRAMKAIAKTINAAAGGSFVKR